MTVAPRTEASPGHDPAPAPGAAPATAPGELDGSEDLLPTPRPDRRRQWRDGLARQREDPIEAMLWELWLR